MVGAHGGRGWVDIGFKHRGESGSKQNKAEAGRETVALSSAGWFPYR